MRAWEKEGECKEMCTELLVGCNFVIGFVKELNYLLLRIRQGRVKMVEGILTMRSSGFRECRSRTIM